MTPEWATGGGTKSAGSGGTGLADRKPASGRAHVPSTPGAAQADAAVRAEHEAVRGHALLHRGDHAAAIPCYQRAVALQPGVASYHVNLAVAAYGAGHPQFVARHAAEALRLDPRSAKAYHVMARWLDQHGRQHEALDHSRQALELVLDDIDYRVHHATLLFNGGRTAEAREAIAPAMAAGSNDRWLAVLYARMAPALEEQAQALAVVERAAASTQLGDGPDGKPLLHFAAATLLDKMGRYDDAFEKSRLGNEALRTGSGARHDAAAHSAWIDRIIAYFTPSRIKSLPRATHDSARPVFVLGMPRSGTTLVEQILGRHPSVQAGGELQSLRKLVQASITAPWAGGVAYPNHFDELSLAQADRIASQYLQDINAIDSQTRYVVDKQPLNFLILAVVQLMLPRSRVIHCVRGALDNCLSCYMTNFDPPNPYKFDLADLGAYYRDYVRLMRHWASVLTVPTLEVRYEDVVLDTPGQVRRMLEFLDLPWDQRCLSPERSERRVWTASIDQVRRPIYTDSIGRWKHYEKHLGPLIGALKSMA